MFYWTSCVNNTRDRYAGYGILVSILVLLDFLRQLQHEYNYLLSEFGFNPCFIGLPASTLTGPFPCGFHRAVSILVLLDFLRQPVPHFTDHRAYLGFQSLFYWTSCVNMTKVRLLLIPHLCFNPCFIGLPASTSDCYRGIRLDEGVSILVLLDFLRQLYIRRSKRNSLIVVSILVLLDFLRQRVRSSHFAFSLYIVSILVLLDFLRQPPPSITWQLVPGCFNPCFIGLPASTRSGKGEVVIVFQSFNPCFIGLPASTNRAENPSR